MEYIYQPEDLKAALPSRDSAANKGSCGKVLVIAGSRNMCGAAYLCAKAAYRTGAGLVYIYTEACNRVILQQLLPEAVLLTYEPDDWQEEHLRTALEGKGVVIAGPGLGTQEWKTGLLRTVLRYHEGACLFDADALNLMAGAPALWNEVRRPLIVTPHIGEMHRLTQRTACEIKAHAAQIAMEFSRAHGIVTVLKDAQTVTSDGSECAWNTAGNHGMATGGSGDVLAGIIGGLLAQKLPLFEAARLGVYVHALAGDAARAARGAYSMMAGDIAEYILFGIS